MKLRYIIIILFIFAWPLYYLYELQLGAISFLLLAIFFLFIAIKEYKKQKGQKEMDNDKSR
jgi:heme O synthase-like polyprenyltransferase